jgi:hypothetical protein
MAKGCLVVHRSAHYVDELRPRDILIHTELLWRSQLRPDLHAVDDAEDEQESTRRAGFAAFLVKLVSVKPSRRSGDAEGQGS